MNFVTYRFTIGILERILWVITEFHIKISEPKLLYLPTNKTIIIFKLEYIQVQKLLSYDVLLIIDNTFPVFETYK